MNAFLQMGLVSNTGATWLYNRAMGINKALELLYTGDWLEADEALRLGVLNRLVPAERLGGGGHGHGPAHRREATHSQQFGERNGVPGFVSNS